MLFMIPFLLLIGITCTQASAELPLVFKTNDTASQHSVTNTAPVHQYALYKMENGEWIMANGKLKRKWEIGKWKIEKGR